MRASWALFALSVVSSCLAQPAQVPYSDCTSASTRASSTYDPTARINVTNVYAELRGADKGKRNLTIIIVGATGQKVSFYSDADGETGRVATLATLRTNTTALTFDVSGSLTGFCDTVRPASPLPSIVDPRYFYCPVGPGRLAFAATSQWNHDYQLITLTTRVQVVDSSTPPRELACIDVNTTPIQDNGFGGRFGYAQILFWLSVGLVAAYWIVVGAARISAAWARGAGRGRRDGWSGVRWAGTMFASAVSGERLSSQSALLRFATPSWRDVFYHTQWCASLAMIAVSWPRFAYPILANAAWSTLLFNITTRDNGDHHWDPWATNYDPPSDFADQLADQTSPLYLQSDVKNTFFLFPNNTADGIPSLAYTIGLRPQDLFETCLILFLGIVAAAIVVSSLIWVSDWLISSCMGTSRKRGVRGTMSPRYSAAGGSDVQGFGKETSDAFSPRSDDELSGFPSTPSRTGPKVKRWWQYRLGQSSFHGSVLQGNLVRLLILFHLPITIFSTYQFTRSPKSSTTSIVLAVVAFAVFSVLIPVLLLVKLAMTPTNKLYDATRTLLALGPLYSQYAHGSQMFAAVVLLNSLALGITIGAGQKSGTAQAIIILIIEVISALATSIWLPWGERASMGVMSFLFCVARIVTSVLLVILTPVVSVGDAAGAWIAYAIIVIQVLIFIGYLLMLIVKVLEGFVRLFGSVPFDKSTHSLDSGLLGALSLAGCCGSKRRRAKRTRDNRYRRSRQQTNQYTAAGAVMPGPTPQVPNGSTGPSGTPSFLRPEQALLPYREDADDESGFIMDSWRPYTQPGYRAVDIQPESNASDASVASSGFARVGGGRAHYESPFAIAAKDEAGQTQPRTQSPLTSTSGRPSSVDGTPSPTRHTRKQSHFAVVENVGNGRRQDINLPNFAGGDDGGSTGSSVPPKRRFWNARPLSHQLSERADEEENDRMGQAGPSTSKTSRWFGRRSKDEQPSPASDPYSEGGGGQKSSFVVVRDKKPARNSAGPSTESGPAPAEDAPKAFVVVRPPKPGAAGPSRLNS